MRFSLADMLWTVGLLALAVAGIPAWWHAVASGASPFAGITGEATALQAPISLGAAIGAPFHRKRFGAFVGFALLVIAIGLMPEPNF